jgi:hypothetical protein
MFDDSPALNHGSKTPLSLRIVLIGVAALLGFVSVILANLSGWGSTARSPGARVVDALPVLGPSLLVGLAAVAVMRMAWARRPVSLWLAIGAVPAVLAVVSLVG